MNNKKLSSHGNALDTKQGIHCIWQMILFSNNFATQNAFENKELFP